MSLGASHRPQVAINNSLYIHIRHREASRGLSIGVSGAYAYNLVLITDKTDPKNHTQDLGL